MAPKKTESAEGAEKPAREYTRRTPAERAQTDLDKANGRVEKAQARVDKAESEVEKAKKELTRAQRFAEFAAASPDLPAPDESGEVSDETQGETGTDVDSWSEGEKIDVNA